MKIKRSQRNIANLIKKHGLVAGGGVDAHSENDFISFSKNKKYAIKTIGMTEKIVKETGVSTKWSSLIFPNTK
jgi:histidinol phosphatase-like PHP family hydrolase